MLVVVAIVGLIAGISFPSVSAGLEGIRLSSAAGSLVSFVNGALNRAQRREEVVVLFVSTKDNAVWMRSAEPGFERRMEMPDGIRIAGTAVRSEDGSGLQQFVILPGGTAPRIGIDIVNQRGTHRIVNVDPITGVPQITSPEAR